jgi:hypothetical protein
VSENVLNNARYAIDGVADVKPYPRVRIVAGEVMGACSVGRADARSLVET